jgi:hypothetical protein
VEVGFLDWSEPAHLTGTARGWYLSGSRHASAPPAAAEGAAEAAPHFDPTPMLFNGR